MRRRAFLGMLAGAGMLAAGGCSSVRDPHADRGEGVIVNYVAPFDKMWATLPPVLNELGLKVAGDNMAEGILRVEQGASAIGWGESLVIFVERIGTKGHTRVEVVTKGTLGVNLSLSDWAKQIHDKLALHFKRL